MRRRRRIHRAEHSRRASDTQDCSFAHDDLGRLQSVNCGSEWSQTFSTDPFGDVAVTPGSNDAFPAQFLNDRISSVNGFAPNYDADGNLLDNPLTQTRNVYGWDADGRPITVDGVSQTFDALGRLVYNTAGPRQVVWTPDGYKAAVMNGQALTFALVPLPGGAVANFGPSGISYYAHPDWEGSWRLASSPSRSETGDDAYSPYGAAYAGSGPDAFTGQWVDTPDNLNDFPKRFLQPMMARWLSPDPSGMAAVNPANPQSWNAYAYVGDTPLQATDPLGLGVCQGAPLPGEPIPDGPVQFNCPSQGFVGGYLMQTFTVSATPEAAPAPMWEMACGPGCISGALGDAAAALQAAVNSFVDEMSYHPNSPGAGGGGGAGGGSITTSLTISGPANGDVPLNPRAQAIFGLVGQETGSLTGWKFWAGWSGSAAAVALLGPEAGPAWDALSSGARWAWGAVVGSSYAAQTAADVFVTESPTAAQNIWDFATGLAPGSPPAYTWGGLAIGAYQIATCPPWESGCP